MNVDKIRKDFEILNKNIIYFDNACVSLKPRQVINAINSYYNEFPACGGRSHHKLGNKVTSEVNIARNVIKKFINAKKSDEIIFTRNTTEGINLVMNSLNLKNGTIITTDKEHNSNLLPVQILSKKGLRHIIIKSNEDNTFNLRNFENEINKEVKLVSVVYTSNLDGVTNPVKEIIKISHDYGALTLLDGAQAVPHKEIDVKKLNVDFLCFSGHKMLGPSGTGVLYGKYDLLNEMKPFLVGGDTVIDTTYDSFKLEKPPEKFEAGLQNYAGIIGLGEAAKYLMKINRKDIEKHEIKLNNYITENLIENVELIGPKNASLRSGIFSFNVKGMNSHNVAMILDSSKNIMIRSGMHCVHSWFNEHKIDGSARTSLYLYNTEEECEVFVDAVKKLL